VHLQAGGAWIQSVIGLLDVATQQLESSKEAAWSAIERAASLVQEQMRAQSREGPPAQCGLLAWQVRKVREYVDVHITERMSVLELSAVVSLSEGHFSRAFKQAFGLTPHSFVVSRRLELAARLMLESNASLKDIALHCGFTDQSHFCSHFRRLTGESPAAWRRTRRAERGGSTN
jgi:AraC family transcriptional regulator